MALVTWSANPTYADAFAAADLNGLASTSQKTSTLTAPLIDNTVDLALFVQFEAVLASITPASGGNLIVALQPQLGDASGFVSSSDGTSASQQLPWVNYPHVAIQLRTGTTQAQNQQSAPVPLPPGRFQPVLINRAGVALAASGNMVRWRKFSEAVT